ncbi:MAG: hypothetical protein ABIV28_09185 [Longimicrobiales bacterium]
MRRLRRFTQVLLTIVGSGIILYAVLAIPTLYNRVLVAGLGLFLVEAGIWEFTRSLFPNEREYRPLRRETDYFLSLVRRMNRAALRSRESPMGEAELDRLYEDLHHSVDRMRRLAGMTDDELGFRHRGGMTLAIEDQSAGLHCTRDGVSARAS